MKQLILFLCFFLIASLSAQTQDNYFGDFDIEDFAETIPFLRDTDEINAYLNSKDGPNNLDLDLDGRKDFLGVTIKRGNLSNERLIFVDAVLKPVRDYENVLHEQKMKVCAVVIRRTGYLIEVEVYGEKAVFGEEIYLYKKFYLNRNEDQIHHHGLDYYDYYNPIYCGRFFLFLFHDTWHPYHYTWRWRYLYPGFYPYPWFYTRIIIIEHHHFYHKVKTRRRMRSRHNVGGFDRLKESRVISGTLQKRHAQRSSCARYKAKIKDIRRSNPVYKNKKILRSSPRKEIKRSKGVIIRKRTPKKIIKPKYPKRDDRFRLKQPKKKSTKPKSPKRDDKSKVKSKKPAKSKTIKKPAETKKRKSSDSYQKPPKVKQKSSTKSRSIKKSSSGKRSSPRTTKQPAKSSNPSNKNTTKSRRR